MKYKLFSFFLALTIPLCAMTAAATPEEDFQVAATAALLVDENSGTVMYEKDIHTQLAPASLTKIMTGLLVVEAIERGELTLDQEITVSANAMTGLSGVPSFAMLRTGEILTVEQLLQCMLVVSADEASHVLAEAVCPTRDEFVTLMNSRAQALGCEDTLFTNPSGLHVDEQHSTAWDLYLIAREAMTHDLFQEIVDLPNVTIPATNLSNERLLYTTNALLSQFRLIGYVNTDATGVQSGYNEKAGHCLLTVAQQDNMNLFSVVLGAQRVQLDTGSYQTQSYSETNRLLDWGFDEYHYQVILEPGEVLGEVPVSLSAETNYVTIAPANPVEVLLPNSINVEDIQREVTLFDEAVEAPVRAGDVLGEVTLTYHGKEYGSAELLARHGVELSQRLVYQRDFVAFVTQDWLPWAGVGVLVLIALFYWLRYQLSKRRYRYGKSVAKGSRSYRGRRN